MFYLQKKEQVQRLPQVEHRSLFRAQRIEYRTFTIGHIKEIHTLKMVF